MRAEAFPGAPERQLWVLDDAAAQAAEWRALDARYDGTGPEGLLIFTDPSDRRLEWADPRTIFVGHAPDGRHARVAYFSAARTVPNPDWPPVDPPYRLVERTDALAAAVIAMWLREGVLPEAEARRRAAEILLVAVDAAGTAIGVATTYLQRNEQLQLDMWHVRAYVSAAHRRTSAATALAVGARDRLEAAYISGDDVRAPGLIMEVEHPALKQAFSAAVWNEVDIVFIGENERGDHVRVYYFAGARFP